jgi:hypothetical protein
MAFSGNCLTLSFRLELLQGYHDFGPGGNLFRLALYTSAATLNETTETYSSDNEIADTGDYTAGGVVLAPVGPELVGHTAVVAFNDVAITGGEFVTRGALVYNADNGRSVAVLDFGADKISAGGVFEVRFAPTASPLALIQIR